MSHALVELAQCTEEQLQEVIKLSVSDEQVEVDIVHSFSPGLYIREMHVPAGTMVIGKYHNTSHLNYMLKGKCVFSTPKGVTTEVTAPFQATTGPGRKIAYFTEDSVWVNVFPTETRDVETLEKELFQPETALVTEHQSYKAAYEALGELEREDFSHACRELGFSEEDVRTASLNASDCIPFPDGSYKVIVQDSYIEGKGLFATAKIKSGEVIAPARVSKMRTPAGRYTNHSVLPNAEMVMLPNGDVNLVATLDIEGSSGGCVFNEITVDYVEAFLNTRIEE